MGLITEVSEKLVLRYPKLAGPGKTMLEKTAGIRVSISKRIRKDRCLAKKVQKAKDTQEQIAKAKDTQEQIATASHADDGADGAEMATMDIFNNCNSNNSFIYFF